MFCTYSNMSIEATMCCFAYNNILVFISDLLDFVWNVFQNMETLHVVMADLGEGPSNMMHKRSGEGVLYCGHRYTENKHRHENFANFLAESGGYKVRGSG